MIAADILYRRYFKTYLNYVFYDTPLYFIFGFPYYCQTRGSGIRRALRMFNIDLFGLAQLCSM